MVLADRLIGPEEDAKRPIGQGQEPLRLILCADDEFDEFLDDEFRVGRQSNVLTASEDWMGTRNEPIMLPADVPAIYVGSVREGMPGISDQDDPREYGETGAEALDGPFSGSRTMCVYRLLGEEVSHPDYEEPPFTARQSLRKATVLADSCSKRICDEVIQDSTTRNYIPGPHTLGYLHHPQADPSRITILRQMGINTADVRNLTAFPIKSNHHLRRIPAMMSRCRYTWATSAQGPKGRCSGYDGWLSKWYTITGSRKIGPANPPSCSSTRLRTTCTPPGSAASSPALLEHFPGLQIFATTHSPFVVAGLKAGQVHLLKRDENGVVTTSTNTEDIIGWTADQILRTMMGVDDPTDQDTANRLNRLRQLRDKETLTPEEESELNDLRRREM